MEKALFQTEPRRREFLGASAVILPEQFHTAPARTLEGGEVALMRAVLEEALECFQKQCLKSGRRAQRLANEAEDWIFSDEVSWPFSFVNICAVLGLEPGYIRLKLKRWRKHVGQGTRQQLPSWRRSSGLPALRASGA
jgi:hypothetical protein